MQKAWLGGYKIGNKYLGFIKVYTLHFKMTELYFTVTYTCVDTRALSNFIFSWVFADRKTNCVAYKTICAKKAFESKKPFWMLKIGK